jgi:methylase of polypeptide subunit release factors
MITLAAGREMPVRADVPCVERLKAVLAERGYLDARATAALGLAIGASHRRTDLPLFLRRLAPAEPLHVLIRLFGLFTPAGEDEARAALAPLALEEVEQAGLVERRGREVRARVGLTAFEGLLLAHDRLEETSGQLAADHVLGVNPSTVNLAQLTIRRRVRSALDMGCGLGVHALLLAGIAERVTGVDVNERALAFARFNARVNGVDNVEWLSGDFFAPVAGRRFDLVVSNPPYVISPESRFVFRDGGRRSDEVSAEVVRGAAAHLEEGGHATVVCNWALRAGEEWSTPPRRWIEGTGCDALVLFRGQQDALEYAAVWNRSADRAAYADALDRWVGHLEALGVAAVGMGAVVLRRRAGASHFVHAEELPDRPQRQSSDHLLGMLAAQDALAAAGDGKLPGGLRCRAHPRHRVEQRLAPDRDGYRLEEARLRLEDGLGFDGLVDRDALELLRLCDGRRTLGDAVGAVCRDGRVERGAVVAVARQFLAMGFLVPAEDGAQEGRS